MARLIPSFMDDRTPPGERDVFNLLSGGPDDWVALHSLDLAPWNRSLRTEIDFVVIVPDTGLLCIEVKSHETVSFDGARWSPPEIKRSPFKQAADAAHTFHRRLVELAPHLRRVPVVHCCIFPRATFEIGPNLSVQPWELIDARAFRAFRHAEELSAGLKLRMAQSIEADRRVAPLERPLTHPQVETIIGFCTPVQKHRPDAREEILRRELEMDRVLRDQQKPVIQLTAMNPRVLVSGAAGTGKTLIAMEVARRAADRGRRVALLCFNQLVGDWLKRQIDSDSQKRPNLIVGRAIRVMAELTDVRIPSNPPASYWDVELPTHIQERLTDPEVAAVASFDYVVVDEAQDLFALPRIWECVTAFMQGGVADGAFCLFGDFENQVLGQREVMNRTLADVIVVARPVQYRLTENCRNYRIVGESAVQLSGLSTSLYEGYLRVGGGVQNYDIYFYRTEQEQRDKLAEWLKDFRAQGYRSSEITVLSFRAAGDSVASRLAAGGFKLRPLTNHPADGTGYSSVHAFKGLENKVVVLTDVTLSGRDFQRDLFYTGMTRACETVRILCDASSQATLTDWLANRTTR
jgi:hypothetical protein